MSQYDEYEELPPDCEFHDAEDRELFLNVFFGRGGEHTHLRSALVSTPESGDILEFLNSSVRVPEIDLGRTWRSLADDDLWFSNSLEGLIAISIQQVDCDPRKHLKRRQLQGVLKYLPRYYFGEQVGMTFAAPHFIELVNEVTDLTPLLMDIRHPCKG